MVAVIVLFSGLVATGDIPKKFSRKKNIAFRVVRMLFGFLMLLFVFNLPLRSGCGAGGGLTQYTDTFLTVIYIPIFGYLIFDAAFLFWMRKRAVSCETSENQNDRS